MVSINMALLTEGGAKLRAVAINIALLTEGVSKIARLL